jgi:hypothetical protein
VSPSGRPSRADLKKDFWDEVRETLIDEYDRSPQDADGGINRYRLDTERRKLGEIVYNQGVERTAEIVEGVLVHGLPG